MISFAIIISMLISSPGFSYPHDQIPDYLIVGGDTILLKSFPLERLGFEMRPFRYGNYDFPDPTCYRGYQAVWKVIDRKLYLVEIRKADGSHERIDVHQYFAMNNYTPVVRDGLIFAEWFSEDLRPFPRLYGLWGCVFKSRIKKDPTLMRFENGILKRNRL